MSNQNSNNNNVENGNLDKKYLLCSQLSRSAYEPPTLFTLSLQYTLLNPMIEGGKYDNSNNYKKLSYPELNKWAKYYNNKLANLEEKYKFSNKNFKANNELNTFNKQIRTKKDYYSFDQINKNLTGNEINFYQDEIDVIYYVQTTKDLNCYLVKMKKETKIYVIFRGTASLQSIKKDLDFGEVLICKKKSGSDEKIFKGVYDLEKRPCKLIFFLIAQLTGQEINENSIDFEEIIKEQKNNSSSNNKPTVSKNNAVQPNNYPSNLKGGGNPISMMGQMRNPQAMMGQMRNPQAMMGQMRNPQAMMGQMGNPAMMGQMRNLKNMKNFQGINLSKAAKDPGGAIQNLSNAFKPPNKPTAPVIPGDPRPYLVNEATLFNNEVEAEKEFYGTNEYELVITGHSLGGALATIFGMELIGMTKTYGYLYQHVDIITYGSPKVFNTALNWHFNKMLEKVKPSKLNKINNEKNSVSNNPGNNNTGNNNTGNNNSGNNTGNNTGNNNTGNNNSGNNTGNNNTGNNTGNNKNAGKINKNNLSYTRINNMGDIITVLPTHLKHAGTKENAICMYPKLDIKLSKLKGGENGNNQNVKPGNNGNVKPENNGNVKPENNQKSENDELTKKLENMREIPINYKKLEWNKGDCHTSVGNAFKLMAGKDKINHAIYMNISYFAVLKKFGFKPVKGKSGFKLSQIKFNGEIDQKKFEMKSGIFNNMQIEKMKSTSDLQNFIINQMDTRNNLKLITNVSYQDVNPTDEIFLDYSTLFCDFQRVTPADELLMTSAPNDLGNEKCVYPKNDSCTIL